MLLRPEKSCCQAIADDFAEDLQPLGLGFSWAQVIFMGIPLRLSGA